MNGRVFAGRYELGSLIGQGGMGQVWQGYDHTLERRVAVKLLHSAAMAGSQADDVRRRFLRECRVTARISHPGLVTVYDAGSDGDELYLVMEYIEGADLADHMAEHEPYPWRWAASLAAQLCSVLAAVHAVPVVHRDLKPRNIMVRPEGAIAVLDLGIAAVLDIDTTRLTRTGVPVGSPAYMAPEQAMGGGVGPYTDIYALGVVLYELLTGAVPFADSTALGVLRRHLYEPPRPVREAAPEVPEALAALVERLLAKDPGERPATVRQVYGALAALLPPPGAGPAPGPLDPTRPFRRPHAPWPEHTTPVPTARPGQSHEQGHGQSHEPSPDQSHQQTAGQSPDIAAAVDEAKRLLGEGRITQAVDVLGGILPAAVEAHGEGSHVVRVLRKQYAATCELLT